MRIGIDMDLSIVRSDLPWKVWLDKHFVQISEIPEKEIDYNLGAYYGESKTGLDKMDFWRNNHLYDDLEIIPDALDAIKAFKEEGINLGFLSHTKTGHFKSKFRLLKRIECLDFSGGDAFMATKEKGFLSGSIEIMIDDRNKFLNQFDESVLKVKVATNYTQDEPEKFVYDLETSDWKKIKDFVLEYKRGKC